MELVSENDELYVIDSAEDEDQLAASFDLAKRPSTGNEDEEGQPEKVSLTHDLKSFGSPRIAKKELMVFQALLSITEIS